MKLAYLAFLPEENLGVERHILARAEAAKFLGINNIEFIVIGGSIKETKNSNDLINHIPYNVIRFSPRYFAGVFQRYREIDRLLPSARYDRIIMRYAGADPSGPGFFRRIKTITEHHSDELSEMQAKIDSNFPFAEKQLKRLRYAMESKYGPQILDNCHGIIGVTEEIKQLELERASSEKKAIAIPNGIDVDAVIPTGFVPFDGKILNLAFVASILEPIRAPWHGLDRVIKGIEQYEGSTKIRLHLIGKSPSGSLFTVHKGNSEIVQHGVKVGKELDRVLENMSIAFSTLGLHRQNMREACTLKTREYVARGLPFVVAYDDPDLSGVDTGNPFFLQIAANDEPVDFTQVVEFAEYLAQKENGAVMRTMRQHARERMDWKIKVKQMVRFAEST